MESEAAAPIDTEQEFYDKFYNFIESTSQPPSAKLWLFETIDLLAIHGAEYLDNDKDVVACCERLLNSKLFSANEAEFCDALVTTFIDCERPGQSYITLYLIFLHGFEHSRIYKLLKRAGSIPAIINAMRTLAAESVRFARLSISILYEVCRVQKLSRSDLASFDQETIWFLLRYIELARDDDDPSSYKCIKLLIALNEQYMVASLPQTQQPFPTSPSNTSLSLADSTSILPQENCIINVLSAHGPRFKSFGENLIRLLNRERDPAVQLLILKALFLLFTNEATYDYFYTNDLHVLVDVFIRELYDLPLEAEALRHTYLRVLHPLLMHSQLRDAPHYKPVELVKLLASLNVECSHFGPIGATTVRLLARCLTVPWLLPPRKRRLRLPKPPSFPERKRSLVNSLLSFSLGTATRPEEEEVLSSSASVRSFDSVVSVAKVKPPPPKRKGLAPLVEGKPAPVPTTSVTTEAAAAAAEVVAEGRGRRAPPPPVPTVKPFQAELRVKPLVPERRRTPATSMPTTPTKDDEEAAQLQQERRRWISSRS